MEQENIQDLTFEAIQEFYNLKGNIEDIKQWHVKYTPDLVKSQQVFSNIMESYKQEYEQCERMSQVKTAQQERLKKLFGPLILDQLKDLPWLSDVKGCDCYFVKIKTMSERDMVLGKCGRCVCGAKNSGFLDIINV